MVSRHFHLCFLFIYSFLACFTFFPQLHDLWWAGGSGYYGCIVSDTHTAEYIGTHTHTPWHTMTAPPTVPHSSSTAHRLSIIELRVKWVDYLRMLKRKRMTLMNMHNPVHASPVSKRSKAAFLFQWFSGSVNSTWRLSTLFTLTG